MFTWKQIATNKLNSLEKFKKRPEGRFSREIPHFEIDYTFVYKLVCLWWRPVSRQPASQPGKQASSLHVIFNTYITFFRVCVP